MSGPPLATNTTRRKKRLWKIISPISGYRNSDENGVPYLEFQEKRKKKLKLEGWLV
jgi:hypothetical protein